MPARDSSEQPQYPSNYRRRPPPWQLQCKGDELSIKTVYQLLPCSFYDIRGLERWLEEMAQRGLFLHHFSIYLGIAVFRRDTPKTVRYRLDPTDAKGIDPERNNLYAQAGWDLVDVIPSAFYLFSCDNPAAPELHTDSVALSYALRRVIRRYIRRHLILFGIIYVLLGLLLAQSGQTIQLDILLGCSSIWQLCYFAILLLFSIPAFLLPLVRLLGDYRALSRGLEPKAGLQWQRLPALLLVVLIWIPGRVIDSQTTTFQQRQYHLSPAEELSLTHELPDLLTVAETGGLGTPELGQVTEQGRTDTSPLAPVQEFLSSSGVLFQAGTENSITAQLQVQYVQGSSTAFGRRVLDGLLQQHAATLEAWAQRGWKRSSPDWDSLERGSYTGFVPMEHSAFDELSAARFRRMGWDGWCFVGRRENEVISVFYTGSGNLESCLDLYAQALGWM